MQRCRQCDYVGENDRDVRQHYKAVGHPTTPRKKPEAATLDAHDEGALISAVTRAFDRMDLPDDGVRRVIAYITDRYLPSTAREETT
ncbi:MAG: hypothetical protein ACYCUI_07225 [Vulcanimicrobiaceae bacterium]